MAIDIEGLTHSFGATTVLSDVSLSVPEGEFHALVGPNGAGKTTLLGILNGTRSPDAGRVTITGNPVGDLSAKAVARRIATVPQDTHIAFDFGVRQVVAMGRHAHRPRFGIDPDPGAVDRALARTGVTDLADRPIGSVSGGERQRVLLARALAQDAPVLALDEPTASLDLNHQVETLDLIRSLVHDGHTAIAAIHDLNLAARYCDAIAVLANGQIAAQGPPERVLTESVLEETFDADAVVRDHPVTGSPLITALGDREFATGDGEDRSTSGRDTRDEDGEARLPTRPE